MLHALVKAFSLDDFLAMPETEPESEYFDNEIIQKPFAGGKPSCRSRRFGIFILIKV